MSLYKFVLILLSLNYIFGCVEKTTYSGKLIDDNDLSNIDIFNKNDLISNFGHPSYEDEINKKLFYYTQMNKTKNFY